MYYASSNASVNMMDPNYATAGNVGATAVNESSLGTGQQQRADVSARTRSHCRERDMLTN